MLSSLGIVLHLTTVGIDIYKGTYSILNIIMASRHPHNIDSVALVRIHTRHFGHFS